MASSPVLCGRYEFQAHIGKGGFGVVDQYLDLLIGQPVAIKTIKARFVNQEAKRLVREIDIMTHFHGAHPHIIDYFSVFATPADACDPPRAGYVPPSTFAGLDVQGLAYKQLPRHKKFAVHHAELTNIIAAIRPTDSFDLHIVMPLMNGDLYRFINFVGTGQKELTPVFVNNVSAVFAFQICFALDYLHKCGIVHRDIKPDNILTVVHRDSEYTSSVIIADFGLARDTKASDTFYVCTRHYRPPEVITNVARGETSIDIWSFGCVVFELVTGCTLFQVTSALNEQGAWEGEKASAQLETILNIIGTPNAQDVHRYMPEGNAKLYMLRSVPRGSILVKLIHSKWRMESTREERDMWADMICRCLAFFPQQRPSAEELCKHELFRWHNIRYGDNARQFCAKPYRPARVGTLMVENKEIMLRLVRDALSLITPPPQPEICDGADEDELTPSTDQADAYECDYYEDGEDEEDDDGDDVVHCPTVTLDVNDDEVDSPNSMVITPNHFYGDDEYLVPVEDVSRDFGLPTETADWVAADRLEVVDFSGSGSSTQQVEVTGEDSDECEDDDDDDLVQPRQTYSESLWGTSRMPGAVPVPAAPPVERAGAAHLTKCEEESGVPSHCDADGATPLETAPVDSSGTSTSWSAPLAHAPPAMDVEPRGAPAATGLQVSDESILTSLSRLLSRMNVAAVTRDMPGSPLKRAGGDETTSLSDTEASLPRPGLSRKASHVAADSQILSSGNHSVASTFPMITDVALRDRYERAEYTYEDITDIISSILLEMEQYTHHPERSRQLRELLNFFAALQMNR